ncbi:hypothetical protein [Paraliomyxa miuraensis]|uniref:hypothetical protein n=1 Tax=Paraliomyxa miuraensis TaxID=376150 RepID=UPI002255376A|nr:hypothetical protein [Paraliomyxa miuraensis]MCX4239162.1 hypothetical protein [Paraliomyxa miuraensis]
MGTEQRYTHPHLAPILDADSPSAVLVAWQGETPLGAWPEDGKDEFVEALLWDAEKKGLVRDERGNHPELASDIEGRMGKQEWLAGLRFERLDTCAGLRLRERILQRQLEATGKHPMQTAMGRQLEKVADELGRVGLMRPASSPNQLGTLVEFVRGLARGGNEQGEGADTLAVLRLRVEALEQKLVNLGKVPVQTPTGPQLKKVAEELEDAAKGIPTRRTGFECAALVDLLLRFARVS